jgi:DNA-binding NarL/FixJ family response regulator
MSQRTRRVLLVEDYPLVARVIALALTQRDLEVEIPVGFTPDIVLRTARRFQPDIALLDFWLGDADALDLIGPLAGMGIPVTMLTGMTDPRLLGECLDRGAVGIINKTDPPAVMMERIEAALAGTTVLSPMVRQQLIDEARRAREGRARELAVFQRLDPREQRVLRLMIEGKSAHEMAVSELISISTVRAHIRAIVAKLGVDSQLEAVALARQRGWPPDDG